jgi:hypothetical protein
VKRRSPSLRVRFSYDALMRNEERATGFVLLDGDVIVIE